MSIWYPGQWTSKRSSPSWTNPRSAQVQAEEEEWLWQEVKLHYQSEEHSSDTQDRSIFTGCSAWMVGVYLRRDWELLAESGYPRCWSFSEKSLGKWPLPCQVVFVLKPLTQTQQTADDADQDYKHKSRLVICGNVAVRRALNNYYQPRCSTLAIDAQSDMFSRHHVVKHRYDKCLPHADIHEDDTVPVTPPPMLVKMDIVKPNSVWLKKAIYGLREAPRLWQKKRERDQKLGELELMRKDKLAISCSKPHSSKPFVFYCRRCSGWASLDSTHWSFSSKWWVDSSVTSASNSRLCGRLRGWSTYTRSTISQYCPDHSSPRCMEDHQTRTSRTGCGLRPSAAISRNESRTSRCSQEWRAQPASGIYLVESNGIHHWSAEEARA